MKTDEAYSNLKRIRQILNVLIKHGFGQVIEFFNLDKFLSFGKRVFHVDSKKLPSNEERLTPPERLTLAFEELGPTFVKLGQIMSTRPDLLPVDYVESFKRLQDNLKSFPYSEAKKIIESELEKPIEEVFESIDEEPIAAASIAQVHYAVLKTGEKVVIKVQRPGIEKLIRTDLNILFKLASFVEKKMGDEKMFDPLLIIDEFERSIIREMDFITEASNTERLYGNFKDDPDFHFAKVYWDYTSAKVLTLERLYGFRLDNEEALNKYKIDKEAITKKIVFAYLKQFFNDGFFHADPHLGNILISREGTVLLLDCGMVGSLNKEAKESLAQVFIGVVTHDFERLVEAYVRLGMMSHPFDINSFKMDVSSFMERHLEVPIKQFRISAVFRDLINTSKKHKIKVTIDSLLLMRSLCMLEELSRILYPNINIIETTKPYAFELLKKKLSAKEIGQGMLKLFFDIFDTTKSFPKQMRQILSMIQAGTLRIETNNHLDKKSSEQINRIGNRISMSIIIAGMAIGSSIIIQSADVSLTLWGFPFFGVIGFFLTGFIAFFLIISILRSGKW